jgi:uncharacterized protein YvpB
MKKLFLPVIIALFLLFLTEIDDISASLKKYSPPPVPEVVENIEIVEIEPIPEIKPIPLEFDPLNYPAKQVEIPLTKELNVPFTSQAPTYNWKAPFDEACEETSLLMVHFYYQNLEFDSTLATTEIINFTNWQTQNNYKTDISALEAGLNAKEYFGRDFKTYSGDQVTIENIKKLIASGYPIIMPAAGQLLKNPHFRNGGAPYHMIVITGYNETGFITNDPGTSHGKSYYYTYETIMNGIHDWTGSKSTIQQGPKVILVLEEG